MGQRTGTRSTQVAIPSKTVPNISKITATIRQNIDADKFIPTMASTSWVEIPEKVKSQEKAVEVAIINSIIALPFPDSRIIFFKSFK